MGKMLQLRKYIKETKKAFTMIELIFVIIIVGILAAVALPRIDRDTKQEAADNILAAIRYTQHLALMDYKIDPNNNPNNPNNNNWQAGLWKINFDPCSDGDIAYSITTGAVGASDPANGRSFGVDKGLACTRDAQPNVSKNTFLSREYGVQNIAFVVPDNGAQRCAGSLAFDHLGRLHQGNIQAATTDYATYSQVDCKLTVTMTDNSTFDITVLQETGYASIETQIDS